MSCNVRFSYIVRSSFLLFWGHKILILYPKFSGKKQKDEMNIMGKKTKI